MIDKSQDQLKVLDGNRASAYGVKLCRPDVICAYPIAINAANNWFFLFNYFSA